MCAIVWRRLIGRFRLRLRVRFLPLPGKGQLSLGFLSVCLCSIAWSAGIPISSDSDSDGLIDLDEVSVQIEVSAGPSNESIHENASGFCLGIGDSLLVRAEGTVLANTNLGLESGPEGLEEPPSFPLTLDTAPHMALIAKIELAGSWFLVGAERLVEATATGELFFSVNDVPGSFQNNSGTFDVTLGRGVGSDPDNPDSDGDGVLDGKDGAPLDPTETLDSDGDGIGNNVDPDDDDDGLFDSEEQGASFNLNFAGTTDLTCPHREGQ